MTSLSRSQFHEANVSHIKEVLETNAVPVFVGLDLGVLDVMLLCKVKCIRGLVGFHVPEAALAVG